MALLARFDPPASADDFDGIAHQRDAWDEFIEWNVQVNVEALRKRVQTGQFYNPKRTDGTPVVVKPILWSGFPRLLESRFPGNKRAAWEEAEKLDHGARQQDEYLEWFVTKEAGQITRIDFTCEGPEYWEAMAGGYPNRYQGPRKAKAKGNIDLVVKLYQKYVNPAVQKQDLLDAAGNYDSLNKWNTSHGAMHLTHGANTLGAEINIAAFATIKRTKDGKPVKGEDELIKCAKYGQRGRASDPHIGAEVNNFAREGYRISLANPVGLYLDGLPDTSTWITPDGTDASEFWDISRGTANAILRATLKVPAAKGYSISDIKIGGSPIEFGGQIAEQMLVKLSSMVFGKGSVNDVTLECEADKFGVDADAGPKIPSRR